MGESGCLDDDAALAFAEGRGSPDEREAAERHVDACAPCRQLVSALARRSSDRAGGSTRAAPHALAQGAVIGRFVVLQPIGAGGMGVVYAAYDPELDRKVALKLLYASASAEASEGRRHMLREAQAMARLMHPNVVAIHEVGTHGEQIFLAMEFVDGQNLRHWLGEKPRSPQEILAVLVASGQGLAAAHAAGLVHRDFKPDNVLIARDGRAKVTDFGLARARQDARGGAAAPSDDASTGIAGTPAYMSPEQWEGGVLDARSDQYSFALTLFEALYGELPPSGRSGGRSNDVHPVRVPARRGVAPVVRRVLLRALSAEPAARFASMQELIDELAAAPRRRRRRVGAAIGVVSAMAIAATVAYRAHDARNLCAGDRAADVWNASTKDAVRARFEATGATFAAGAASGVERSIDAFARALVAEKRAACEATRIRHEESEEAFALRSGCLDRRREELAALLEIFAGADVTTVEHAVAAAGKLTPVEACKSSAALAMQPLPPSDPDVRAKIQKLRAELDAVKALLDAGRYPDGLRRAAAAVATADAIGYRPVRAEALYLEGALRDEMSDASGAEDRLYLAAEDAEASRHDEVAAKARALLVWVVGYRRARHEVGEALARGARAAIVRAGSRPDLAAPLENSLGTLYWAEGKYALARERHDEARALWERAYGPENFHVAHSINNRALALWSEARLQDALVSHEQALALRVKLLGGDHPAVAASLNNIGLVAQDLGQFERAADQHRRAIAIEEKVYGPEHPAVANAYNNLGLAELGLGRSEEALRSLSHARRIRERTRGDAHPDVANSLVNLAIAYAALHRTDEALAAIEDGHARQTKELGADHPALVETLLVYASVLRLAGRPRDSLARAALADTLAVRSLGAEHPFALAAHAARGSALVALGRTSEAIPILEAVTARAERLHDARVVGEAAFSLAQARSAESPGDARVAADMALARKKLRSAGPRAGEALATLEAWAAAR